MRMFERSALAWYSLCACMEPWALQKTRTDFLSLKFSVVSQVLYFNIHFSGYHLDIGSLQKIWKLCRNIKLKVNTTPNCTTQGQTLLYYLPVFFSLCVYILKNCVYTYEIGITLYLGFYSPPPTFNSIYKASLVSLSIVCLSATHTTIKRL